MDQMSGQIPIWADSASYLMGPDGLFPGNKATRAWS